MSDPAILPSSAQLTQHAFRRTTTTTATRHASNKNTRAGGGGRQRARAAAAGGVQSQETVTLPSPNILRHASTKRPYLFHDIQQQQQQLSGNMMPPPRAPATLGQHIQNLPYNSNGSLTESTVSSNPWLFMPHAPHPRPISNGEGGTSSIDIQQQQQQPLQQQQQQQQQRRQLPFNSLPTVARTPKRTNSASSTSTTSVTYLRNAAAAFIATAHQNHFQFPHKVLHPDIQPLSAHLDLQQRRDFEDDGSAEQDDDSFTSHELRALPRDIRAKAIMPGGVGNGGIHDHDAEQDLLMTDNDDESQFEDEQGQGFESTTPPLDLGQVNSNNANEEQFGRRPHQYDPILFPSSTATDAADIDAIASSDAPLFPLLSSYRPSPSTSQLNHIRPYWSRSIEKKTDQGLFSSSSSSSVQDHHPSTDRHRHNHLYQYQHRPQQQQQQSQTFFGRRQDNIINNINHKMQGRSASSPLSPPEDDNYAAAYQQEVISDDPSSPPPPLYSHPTSFSHVNNHQQYQRPAAAGDDVEEFVDKADRRSWVSDMNSEERHLTKQQQPHDHPMSYFSPMMDGNGSGQAIARQDSRSEQDREVFEVCSRRLQHGYTPSQNIHKALVSSIRSSFLASLNGSQRASLMNSVSSGIQQSSPREVSDLQDFQQPWYQPQHLPYHASPDQEYVASSSLRQFEKEGEDERRRREEELLAVIAQLEKDLQELHNSSVELQANLRESEERNERMLIEHDCDLRRVKDEHDYQIQDTKKRTKRFYDETMRKRQRDEDKRLQGLQEQLSQAQTANKELKTTIRGLQRERVDVEQGQRDDLAVLCLFIENVLGPLVVGLTSTGGGVGSGGGTGEKIAPLQAVESFKRRRPSTITIPAIATIIAPGEHDLTPTAAVPHPVPFPAVPTKQDGTPKLIATTIFGSQQQQQQCVSPRGQKCMSLLEQFQSALSISFTKALTDTVTTSTSTTMMPPRDSDKTSSTIPAPALQQESPKTPAPFRKTHQNRHSRQSSIVATTNHITKQHRRHDILTEGNDHLASATQMYETERLEYLNSRRARKRYSDSSNASSGHTMVAASAPPPPPFTTAAPSSNPQGVSKSIVAPSTDMTTITTMTMATVTETTSRSSSSPPEKPAAFKTISNPDNATAAAVPSPQKHAQSSSLPTNPLSPSTKINHSNNNNNNNNNTEKEKEKDKPLQQCLAEQHTRYQKEIERIKQQCIKIYRQSLEDVRTDMKFKLGQRRQRASSTTNTATTTAATVAAGAGTAAGAGVTRMARVATATAH